MAKAGIVRPVLSRPAEILPVAPLRIAEQSPGEEHECRLVQLEMIRAPA
jgi:hypothetical protein